MNQEDRLEMACHLEQEALLHRHGFEPVPENGGELWISVNPEGNPELWTRAQALDRIQKLQREAAA